MAVTRYDSIPNDAIIGWKGRVLQERLSINTKEFEVFVDYISELRHDDHTGIQDALLALSNTDFVNIPHTCAAREGYTEALILAMAPEMPPNVRHTALMAAWAFRRHIFAMDNITVKSRISFALFSAVQDVGEDESESGIEQVQEQNSSVYTQRDFCYFGLICMLNGAQTWHPHLGSHFSMCLRIMDKIMDGLWKLRPLDKSDNIGPYIVYALHLFPTIVSPDVKNTEKNSLIQTAADWIWQLIWRAWASFANDDSLWFDGNIRDRSEGERVVMYLSAYTIRCLQKRGITHRELRELKTEVSTTLLVLKRWRVKENVSSKVQELKDRLDWHLTTITSVMQSNQTKT
ncbi:hypothetical protein M422DRAFT_776112 [Sphaerobolus stellatus SS14]|nr:hypothetical protein M422DRAFT_776112 [Sphaerobolus stellatus SS14]